jgi:putative Mn2+ efflux pump MntP
VDSLNFLSVLAIAIGLSADCFAIALSGSISLGNLSHFRVFRTALFFGVVQALMLVLGWLVGRTVVDLVAAYDHWLAFILLLFIGGKMIWESRRPGEDRSARTDITRGWLLLTLSIATSIDALAVGLSFAFLQVDIVLAGVTVGVVTFLAVTAGFLLGKKAGRIIGKRAEVVGGIVLIIIGLRILLTDLL